MNSQIVYVLVFLLGGIASLVVRKLITKQPLLKARADAFVDSVADRYKGSGK